MRISCDENEIPYDKFYDIEDVRQGGSATIYRATWNSEKVALKSFKETNDFETERKAYIEIGEHSLFLKCHGKSRNKNNENILVLEYMKKGSLRDNLESISQMSLNNKLKLFRRITSGLGVIHLKNMIHRDLHSGNILLDASNNVYIADLEKMISLNEEPKEIIGLVPYIAPEVWAAKPYTKASDIYSLGLLMYEILTGIALEKTPNIENIELKFAPEIPKYCVELVERCTNEDPLKRPKISEIKNILGV